MSEPHAPAEAPVESQPSRLARLVDRAAAVVAWTFASRVRMAAAAVAGLSLLAAVVAASSYYGQVALEPVDPASVEAAIAAVEAGRYDEAKQLVGQMQHRPATPKLLGGALLVLGAIKAHEADLETTPERARMVHEMAARYLQKAISLGLAGKRQSRAAFLLGRSLARAGRSAEAIPQLEEALADPAQPAAEIHALLVGALLEGPDSDVTRALSYNERVLADAAAPAAARERALTTGAAALLRLGRRDQARALLVQVPAGSAVAAEAHLLMGRLEIDEAQALAEGSAERAAKLEAAHAQLKEVATLDGEQGPLSRQAALWLARRLELAGDAAAALTEYDRMAVIYAETPEGLTAMLAAADAHCRGGQFERALQGYRQVLGAIDAQMTFDNALMPQADVKRRLTTAYQQCVDEGRFGEALTLVELFEPVFGVAGCAELRAKTLQQWGKRRLAEAHPTNRPEDAAVRREGRKQLRAAGLAFENLARLRFASRQFSDDLWAAADCYFEGQSYTHAARLLEEYLHHEARRQNAMALLKLGQARLAIGDCEAAIVAMEECIEMFPDDAAVHQARLECARAHGQLGRVDAAEQLLLVNLVSGTLRPASPEWRDSLFALGELLYESGRYDEAIAKLQEAVERYPDEESAVLARYTIARAHHDASDVSARRLQEAKTENERQAARAALNEQLTRAHESYQAVQRKITLRGNAGADELDRALLRNCYLMQGSVLFELRRFEEALQAYGNVIASYQNDPIALESFVQVANCWRRLNEPVKARVTLDQARMVLTGLPAETDFLATTNFNRQQWESLLGQMSAW